MNDESNPSKFDATADDIVGIIIHNANQLASHLSVNGTGTDFVKIGDHIARMYHMADRVAKILQADAERAAAAQPN